MKMNSKRVPISEFDRKSYIKIRNNIKRFLVRSSDKYDANGILILDIAPQIHEDASSYFNKATVKTLDINPKSGADYIADITNYNKSLQNEMFDIIVCTEVIEHTLNPFKAVDEIYRLLKKNGILLLSVPFNFRIHGPLPDCWRFSEHGIRELLKKFSEIRITAIETPERNLMPIHYTVVAKK